MQVTLSTREVLRPEIERVSQAPESIEALREQWKFRSPDRLQDAPEERETVTAVEPVPRGGRGQASDGRQPNAFTLQEVVQNFGKNFGRVMGFDRGEARPGLRGQTGPRFRVPVH